MTHTQRAELDKALARAARDGIQLAGRGVRKSDGARVFAVTSASQPGRWYLVALEGERLHCDCPARSYCKHRAAVHAELVRQLVAAQAAQAERDAERAYWRDLASEGNAAALAPSL